MGIYYFVYVRFPVKKCLVQPGIFLEKLYNSKFPVVARGHTHSMITDSLTPDPPLPPATTMHEPFTAAALGEPRAPPGRLVVTQGFAAEAF